MKLRKRRSGLGNKIVSWVHRVERMLPDWLLRHPVDHVLHFLVSFALVFVAFFVLQIFNLSTKTAALISALAILALGAFKEYYIDIRVGEKDIGMDMMANILGVALAAFIVIAVFK